MEQFKIGDAVGLKSGSPLLTIGRLNGARPDPCPPGWRPLAFCYWFAADGEIREKWFPLALLCLRHTRDGEDPKRTAQPRAE